MNVDTSSLVIYLEGLLSAVRQRGVRGGSFRAEAINEIVEVSRDPDYHGDMRPSGKIMVTLTWQWEENARGVMVETEYRNDGESLDERYGQ